MRKAFGILSLVPVLAFASACGGASKVKSEIASIAEPREALAAAAEAMSKESFYLEYEMRFEDEDLHGSYIIARRLDDTAFVFDTEDGEFSFFAIGGKQYFCSGGESGFFGFGGSDGACYEVPEGDEDDAFAGEIDAFFFDSAAMIEELVGDDDALIEDAPDREINGIEGRCFKITATDEGGILCVAKDSGVLLMLDGMFDGDDGKMELKEQRDPGDADFELPYQIQDYSDVFGGISGGTYEEPEPKQDKEVSIPSRRVAGPLYPWETEPALCPDLQLPEFGGLVALGNGRFVLGDFDDSVIVAADCKVEKLELDAFDISGIGDGRVYYSKSTFDGPQIIRHNADGSETTIAGAPCKQKTCTPGGDGKATEVVLDWVQDIAPAADGSIWFLEAITDAKKNDPPYRLRHITAQGELKTVETGRKIDFARLVNGPNGGAYILQFGKDSFLLDSTGKVAKDKLEIDSSCAAASQDGDLWTYDLLGNNLQVRRPDGTTKTFHWAPEQSFFCQQMAVQPNGDLLIQSFGTDDEGGLWLVPNPLNGIR